MGPVLWVIYAALAFFVTALVVMGLMSRILRRRRALLDAAVQGHKDGQLQRCPNCWHPFSEWFLHDGCMYCLLCGPFGNPRIVSSYASHAEWRESRTDKFSELHYEQQEGIA